MRFQTIPQIKKPAHHTQNKYAFEKRIFKVLVTTGVLSICLYVYSLSSVIYGVVERRGLEKEITQLHSDIGASETEYLLASNTLTYDQAVTSGFVKPSTIVYESQERVAFNTFKPQTNGLK